MLSVAIEPARLTANRDTDLTIRFSNTNSYVYTDIVFRLDLPDGFLLLRGNERIELGRLAPGEFHAASLRVRASEVGTHLLTSSNFAYRDHRGRSERRSDFTATLTVVDQARGVRSVPGPALDAVVAEDAVRVELASQELTVGEWQALRGSIRNLSTRPVRNVMVHLTGRIQEAASSRQTRISELAPGEVAKIRFEVRPRELGTRVPVDINVAYTDDSWRTRRQRTAAWVTVRSLAERASAAPSPSTAHRQSTILYLSASPTGRAQLRLDTEVREIGDALRRGRYGNHFRLEQQSAVRARDVGQRLLDYEPRIVHFSGHGDHDGFLHVLSDSGEPTVLTPDALANQFRLHASVLDCVIVNACRTTRLAEAIVRNIDYVVGMRQVIGDRAAIAFSIGFYQGLAAGKPVPVAFEHGCAEIGNQVPNRPEHETPLLLTRAAARV